MSFCPDEIVKTLPSIVTSWEKPDTIMFYTAGYDLANPATDGTITNEWFRADNDKNIHNTPIAIGLGTSCTNKTGNKGVTFDTINVITKEDTTRVFEQTQAFMNLLQANQVDSALNMLSEANSADSAYNITSETKSRLKKQFAKFPVQSYEIVTSEFVSHYRATATYKYKFMENPTEDPNYPCTINLMLKVEYKTGAFRLFLENHAYLTR